MNEQLKVFLNNEFGTISINYDELIIANNYTFEDLQLGYRIKPNTNESLITKEEGGWQEEWYVLVYKDGDAVIFNEKDNRIYYLMHGLGDWEPEFFCDSLGGLNEILTELNKLANGRENPVAFERNPISEAERKNFFKTVDKHHGDTETWELILE